MFTVAGNSGMAGSAGSGTAARAQPANACSSFAFIVGRLEIADDHQVGAVGTDVIAMELHQIVAADAR